MNSLFIGTKCPPTDTSNARETYCRKYVDVLQAAVESWVIADSIADGALLSVFSCCVAKRQIDQHVDKWPQRLTHNLQFRHLAHALNPV